LIGLPLTESGCAGELSLELTRGDDCGGTGSADAATKGALAEESASGSTGVASAVLAPKPRPNIARNTFLLLSRISILQELYMLSS
jgi:hypothetical protein